MPSKYRFFDPSKLVLAPLSERVSRVRIDDLKTVNTNLDWAGPSEVASLAEAIVSARAARKPVIFFIGGHVIKTGMNLYLREFITQGYVTALAGNGSTTIHDFELATHGQTSEHVAREIKEGRFGMWQEDRVLNDIVKDAAYAGRGFGEHLGFWLQRYSARPDVSVFAHAYHHSVPFTVHVLIGADITHMYADAGAALGQASYNDFLIFAEQLRLMQEKGGVFVCIGSAVHGPEIYLKALSMARNVLRRRNKPPAKFTTAVLDMYPLPTNWRDGEADPTNVGYYFRPWKTILLRTLNEGSDSYYVEGDYRDTVPALYKLIHTIELEKKKRK